MPLRVTALQVKRFLFRKQHLTPTTRARDLLSLVRDIGLVRATPSTTMYTSLWARVADFAMQQLHAPLYDDRSLVRMRALQARLYLVPTSDLTAYYQVSRPLLRTGLDDLDDILYVTSALQGARGQDRGHPTSRHLAQRVLEIMSTRGPSTIDELIELFPELARPVPHDPEHPERGHSLLGTRLIPAMCAEGMLVRAQTRGGWRSDLFSYATLASWLPAVDLESMSLSEALMHVTRRFVSAYGPVTVGDVLHWFGEYPRRTVASTLMRIPNLMRIEIEGELRGYFVLKEQLDDLMTDVDEEPAAALLPPRDAFPVAYSDASRLVAPAYADRVYDRAGEPVGTVWLDGQIIGTWWSHHRDQRILVRFFEEEGPEVWALVGEEARRLADLLEFTAPELDIGSIEDKEELLEPAYPIHIHGLSSR